MPINRKKKQVAKESVRNVYSQPRVLKVIVNAGIGKNRDDRSFVEAVTNDLKQITGQHPQARHARQAIAGFNVRQGNLVGLRVTIRGHRRDDFIKRFVNLTLPRVRDFRGVDISSLDGHGNLSIGIAEQLAFPEINSEKTDIIFGVEITFVSSAKTNEEAVVLFRSLGFPLVTSIDKEI